MTNLFKVEPYREPTEKEIAEAIPPPPNRWLKWLARFVVFLAGEIGIALFCLMPAAAKGWPEGLAWFLTIHTAIGIIAIGCVLWWAMRWGLRNADL